MQNSTRISLLIVSTIVAGGLIMTLFTIKYQVQDLEDELVRLNKAVVSDLRAIHVLEAEWSHLNDPARLRRLAERHLGLVEIKPEQLVGIDALPARLVRNTSLAGKPVANSKAVKDGR